jgi:hypothetical protein
LAQPDFAGSGEAEDGGFGAEAYAATAAQRACETYYGARF